MREVEPWGPAPADQGPWGIQWVHVLGGSLSVRTKCWSSLAQPRGTSFPQGPAGCPNNPPHCPGMCRGMAPRPGRGTTPMRTRLHCH